MLLQEIMISTSLETSGIPWGDSEMEVGMGSMAFMVFAPLEIPEPVVPSGQQEETHTHIKE